LIVEGVLAEARARGIAVGEPLGGGSYCEAWAVGDALVLRIPRAIAIHGEPAHGYGPLTGDHVSPTGPFELLALTTGQALEVFELALERQRDVTCRALARLVDRLELAGVTVSLHERAPGCELAMLPPDRARACLPAVARALVELHGQFGAHLDLKPAHIFVDGDRVTFIDPLPLDYVLFGSLGYSLPLLGDPKLPRDEALLLRDAIGLAAIAAESYGIDLDLGRHVSAMCNLFNGRFGRGWDAQEVVADVKRRCSELPDDRVRHFIESVFDNAMAIYAPHHHRPSAGITKGCLERLG